MVFAARRSIMTPCGDIKGCALEESMDTYIGGCGVFQFGGCNDRNRRKRIKNHMNLCRIPPIILVTAYAREDIMRQADKVGLAGNLEATALQVAAAEMERAAKTKRYLCLLNWQKKWLNVWWAQLKWVT
jgi:hypothetical protein